MTRKISSRKMPGHRVVANLAIAVILTAGLAISASAQTAHINKSKKSAQVEGDQNGVDRPGQKAAVDAQTGKLRQPTAAEMKELSEGTKKMLTPSKPTMVTQHADGTLSMELNEEYLDVSVVTINPDGTLKMSCVKGMSKANDIVNATKMGAATKATANKMTRKAAINPTRGVAKKAPPTTERKEQYDER